MLNLNALNDKQLEAVTYESGNLLVLAGPGSGKTFTIIQRLFYLIEKLKVSPEQILVISFTKDSALEMQNRFLSQADRIYPVVFGTFHSVFYHILRDSSGKSPNIISIKQKRKIISDLISRFNNTNQKLSVDDSNNLCDSIINAISFYKNTLDIKKSCARIDEQFSVYFQDILTEYEKCRQADCYIDFDDMVFDCFNLLAHNRKVYEKWNGRFSYILIDEFQDINPIQYKVVRMLMDDATKLFAVGDDDQSIYNFRGSEPGCMKKVIDECECNIINLKYNYRNTEEVRIAAENIIKENASRIPKESVSTRPRNDSAHITVCGYENKESHYDALADFLRDKVNDDFAVLFRTNIEMQRLAVILSKKGIPFICKERKQNIYEHFIVKDIMAYLQLAKLQSENSFNTNNTSGKMTELAARIINKPVRYINRESLIGDGKPIDNVIDYYNNDAEKIFTKKIILSANILKKDLSFINERAMYPAITYILKKIGYQNYILETAGNNKEKQEEYKKIIEWLTTDSKRYESLEEYEEAQRSYSEEMKDEIESSGIQLLTVHASKGLEFKNVVIAECNEGNFPHGRMPDKDTVEEERRLFYVAVTRSSENLFIYYIKGTKERIAIPSRFINYFLDKYTLKATE